MYRAVANTAFLGFALILLIVAQPSSTWSTPTIPQSTGPKGACYDGVRSRMNQELQTIQSREDTQVRNWEIERDQILDLLDAGFRTSKKFRSLPYQIRIMIIVGDEFAPDAVRSHYRSKINGLKFDNNASRGQAGNRARTAKQFCDGLPTTWPEDSQDNGGSSGSNSNSYESDPSSMFNQNFNWNAYWGGSTICDYSGRGMPQRC